MKSFASILHAVLEAIDDSLSRLLVIPKFAALYDEESLLGWLRRDLKSLNPACSVPEALEQLVDVFFVPYCLDRRVTPGYLLLTIWREMAIESLTTESLRGSVIEEVIGSEIYKIASFLIDTASPSSGTQRFYTPEGAAELIFSRKEWGWEYTALNKENRKYGFPEKLCIVTQDLPKGRLARRVSIHDMLVEPREHQLNPYDEIGALNLGSGNLWWPKTGQPQERIISSPKPT